MHALQALLLGRDWRQPKSHVVNGLRWEMDLDGMVPLSRRRDTYVWAVRMAVVGTKWLEDWNLALGDTLTWVGKTVETLGNLAGQG